MFRCSTAHQCSLVQSGYGMATIYTQAIVSDNHCIYIIFNILYMRETFKIYYLINLEIISY